jgi:RHS repeat-associated protein
MIKRKTDKGLPRYEDDNESDVFLLAGAEDLVPVLDAALRPVRTERTLHGTSYNVRAYRPRIERLFWRIERWVERDTGLSHWRTVSRDNVTTLYGLDAGSRIASPDDARHVFSYLICRAFDDRGNVIVYDYAVEDDTGVVTSQTHEANRTSAERGTNRYIKRIRYGNATPYVADAAPHGPEPALPSAFHFEVVFDYGEHTASEPTPRPDGSWPVRPDPFSTRRPGFEVRTYRRCRRVLLFHHFPLEKDVGVDCLVGSTDFAYSEETGPVDPQRPFYSLLSSVGHTGHQRQPGGGYAQRSLPPLELEYTQAAVHATVDTLDAESLADLPAGLEGGRFQWLDLDGEGVSSFIADLGGGAWGRKRNLGPVESATRPDRGPAARARFGPLEPVASLPSHADLGGQHLIDLSGDGELDVVSLEGPLPGFCERTEDESWRPFRPFVSLPSLDWSDPNLRFIDLTGNGLADVLVTEDGAFTFYLSRGADGFGEAHRVATPWDEERGPRVVASDDTQTFVLADMSGDGLSDIVRVRNGEVCYWPNLGYGRFGAKVTMDGAPRFAGYDQFDPRRVRLADIDGSGTADLLYLGQDGVLVSFNQSGNAWAVPHTLAVFPGADALSSVHTIDLLGNGTTCLVWSTALPDTPGGSLRYVDLMGGQKPHLLVRRRNNLGAETRLSYAPSTRFYLADRLAGRPWITHLPHVVHVVERVETYDFVDRTRFVTRYAYHHGHFDGVEREFRGFGMVEQWDAEAYSSAHGRGLFAPGVNERDGEFVLPPAHSKSWFDTGVWGEARDLYASYRTEWYAGDAAAPPLAEASLPDSLSAAEACEAARARAGTLLRREVYADDGTPQAGHPYSVEDHRHDVRRLQPMAGQRHAVFVVHARESVARHYERDPADPRVEHDFTLQVDDFGNVLRTAHVAYPRRVPAEPEQGTLLATCSDSSVVNETDAFHRIGVPIELHSYELTGLPAPPAARLLTLAEVDAASQTSPVISFDAAPASNVTQKRLLHQQRVLYLKNDLSGPLPLGHVESLALTYETYSKTIPASLVASVFGARVTDAILAGEGGYVNLDGDWWRPSGRPTYDASSYYQPVAMTDAFGNAARVVRDAYGLAIIEAHASSDPVVDNVVLAQNDYRVLQASMVTDPNGNQTALAFDALGMVVAKALLGKPGSGEGDTLDDPTTRFEYDLLAWKNAQQPASVHTFAREKHGAANSRWQETYSYSDGGGHVVMRKVQAEPDPETHQPRWVGTGRTVFDNKGNPVKKYEPYFAPAPNYEDEPALVMQGVTPVLRYDALGRLVRTDFPEGTFETIAFDPWNETHADANDNVLESAWYAASTAASAAPQRQRAAALAAKHAHTPTMSKLDPLGRAFLVVADNGALGKYTTRSRLEVQGDVRAVTDARGVVVLQQTFDMEKGVLRSQSVDAGERLTLRDVVGAVARSWDGRGYAIRTRYDALRRPTHVHVQPPTGAEILAELLFYGEATGANGPPNNLRGHVVLHYDGAGELGLPTYDLHGNATTTTRRLWSRPTVVPDWTPLEGVTETAAVQAQARALLESEPAYRATSAFDALDRLVSITTPDGSTILPTYNEANLLERVDAALRGSTVVTPFVTNFDYNARGQRTRADYANGASTTYTYDDETFLLVRQTTLAAGRKLADQQLFYDPVHNPVELEDGADASLYFNGRPPVDGGGQYTYDALYRLATAQGREHPGQQMPDPNELSAAALPHRNDTQAMRAYSETYSYDEVGNILRIAHAAANAGWTRDYDFVPGTHRLRWTSMPGDPAGVAPGADRYAHDASGNMTRMPHLAAIVWDHASRMVSADLGGGGVAYYAYNATGTRVRKVVQRNGSRIEERVYLGAFEIYRQKTSGGIDEQRQTLHVMDGERRLAMAETLTHTAGAPVDTPTPRLRYQLANYLGSSTVELDETARIISYEEYHPFGSTSFRSAEGGLEVSAKRYRYVGKERDDETGLHYYGARYYAAWLGRWTAPDPAGSVDGHNLYAYARNNPIRLSDALGLQSEEPETTWLDVAWSATKLAYKFSPVGMVLTNIETSVKVTKAALEGDDKKAAKIQQEATLGMIPFGGTVKALVTGEDVLPTLPVVGSAMRVEKSVEDFAGATTAAGHTKAALDFVDSALDVAADVVSVVDMAAAHGEPSAPHPGETPHGSTAGSAPHGSQPHGGTPPKPHGSPPEPHKVGPSAPDPGTPTYGNLYPGETQGSARVVTLVKEGDKWYEIGPHGSKSRARGTYDFAVQGGTIKAARNTRRMQANPPGHLTVSGGGRVEHAGQVRFGRSRNGRGTLRNWSNASGHYAPVPPLSPAHTPFPHSHFQPYRGPRGPRGPQLPVFQPR